MIHGLRFIRAGFGLLLLCIGAARADDLPDEVLLRAAGLHPQTARVLFRWEETGTGASVCTGLRAEDAGSPAADYYFDSTGSLMTPGAMALRGFTAKNWTAREHAAAAEIHPGFLKTSPRPSPFPAVPRGPQIVLSPPDLAKAKAQPHASPGAARIGVVEDTPDHFDLRDGQWVPLDDGRWAWSLTLRAPGATGIRLHVDALALPADSLAGVFFGTQTPIAVTNAGWSPTVFGDTVTVTLIAPDAAARSRAVLAMDQVAYLFADWDALLKQSGNCNFDIACEPGWTTTGLGVGGLGTIGGADAIWCTGALIADDDPDTETPWFLTANHCVGNANRAAAIEVYWNYAANGCGGNRPPLASIPRTTGGAAYVAGSGVGSGTDVALLRLAKQPPPGLVWLGWTTVRPNAGNSVVTIHHPRGDVKKISFGNISDAGSPSAQDQPLQPHARFHEVRWAQGTTEPGSSGSPLFRANGRIIGQLWGGRAACNAPDETDYYGRIDQSFPILEPYLGVPPRDPFDVDGNGLINAADLQRVVNAALKDRQFLEADVNESGYVDASDVELALRALLKSR